MMIKYKAFEYSEDYLAHYEGCLGPHEGVELEMMLAGQKPLAMFNADYPPEWIHPNEFFRPFVDEGQLIRRDETYSNFPPHYLGGMPMYHFYYALPEET